MSLRTLFGLTGVASAALGLLPAPAALLGTLHPTAVPVATIVRAPQVPASGPAGTASGRWTYSGLDALIRASYSPPTAGDPKPKGIFNVPAAFTKATLKALSPLIHGVIYGRSAQTNSYWVVADICFRSPTGCEDMGAFQVFHRTGPVGDFSYGTLDICSIPPFGRVMVPRRSGPRWARTVLKPKGGLPRRRLGRPSPRLRLGWLTTSCRSAGGATGRTPSKPAHIDFWEFSGARWAEVGRSTYPTLPGQPPFVRVVGRQLKGMPDATFIATGLFTGDSTGQALAFGNGPRGWGTIAWQPGNVLVPTGGRSTDNTTPGICSERQFSSGQLETTSLNPYFSTARGAQFPLDMYWSWDASASHFVDARDNSFTSSPPKWGKSVKASGPRLALCPQTPLTGTYEGAGPGWGTDLVRSPG